MIEGEIIGENARGVLLCMGGYKGKKVRLVKGLLMIALLPNHAVEN